MSERSERMKVAPDALFDKCVQTVLRKDGTMLICCKLGNWSASGRDRDQLRREAMHYWAQYHSDGEYDEMLSNDKADRTAKAGERVD